MSATSPAPRVTKAQFTTVSLLDSDLARIYTHIHPLIILSIYFLSFSLIVADPVSALASLLAPLIALQVLYVVVCLPPTGSHNVPGHAGKNKSAGPGKKGGKKGEVTLGMKFVVCHLEHDHYGKICANQSGQPAIISGTQVQRGVRPRPDGDKFGSGFRGRVACVSKTVSALQTAKYLPEFQIATTRRCAVDSRADSGCLDCVQLRRDEQCSEFQRRPQGVLKLPHVEPGTAW